MSNVVLRCRKKLIFFKKLKKISWCGFCRPIEVKGDFLLCDFFPSFFQKSKRFTGVWKKTLYIPLFKL